MTVTPIKTHKITPQEDMFAILDKYVTKPPEKSILAVTSKIVSITEGRVVKIEGTDKDALIEQESQYYLSRTENKYNISFTITHNTLAPSAGIDESNGNGYYVLWPENPQKSANSIRFHLKRRWNLNKIGVILTDSKTTPMRWGVTGLTIGYSGFAPLKDYVGMPDLFGRPFAFEKLSLIDCLASAALLVMGEGSEQTPLALIENVSLVVFEDKDPSGEELRSLKIDPQDDLYAPFLRNARWKKGKR